MNELSSQLLVTFDTEVGHMYYLIGIGLRIFFYLIIGIIVIILLREIKDNL